MSTTSLLVDHDTNLSSSQLPTPYGSVLRPRCLGRDLSSLLDKEKKRPSAQRKLHDGFRWDLRPPELRWTCICAWKELRNSSLQLFWTREDEHRIFFSVISVLVVGVGLACCLFGCGSLFAFPVGVTPFRVVFRCDKPIHIVLSSLPWSSRLAVCFMLGWCSWVPMVEELVPTVFEMLGNQPRLLDYIWIWQKNTKRNSVYPRFPFVNCDFGKPRLLSARGCFVIWLRHLFLWSVVSWSSSLLCVVASASASVTSKLTASATVTF